MLLCAENPGQPGKPRVTYNHGAHTLTVVFEAPALSRKYQYTVRIVSQFAAPRMGQHGIGSTALP